MSLEVVDTKKEKCFYDYFNMNIYIYRIEQFLKYFDANKHDVLLTRGLCIYGEHGIGKTALLMNVLKRLNYEIIYYTSSDLKDKGTIENILNLHKSDVSVISYFKKIKNNVIVIDNIENMGTGDKGGVSQLIKIIRPKKTKPQQKEKKMMIPIICISNMSNDKVMKELLKICCCVHVKTPTHEQLTSYYTNKYPDITDENIEYIIKLCNNNVRKCDMYFDLYKNNSKFVINNIHTTYHITYNTKDVVKLLLNNKINIEEHNSIIRDQDRTSVSLFVHENIIDYLPENPKDKVNSYLNILDNICYVDYMDRIIFQKQIWVLNEMSSIIKNISNTNYLQDLKKSKNKIDNIRFTKVLTKYSTEYNNYIFLYNISQKLQLDQKDVFQLFKELLQKNTCEDRIYDMLYNYDLSKLEIDRMKRFMINKYSSS